MCTINESSLTTTNFFHAYSYTFVFVCSLDSYLAFVLKQVGRQNIRSFTWRRNHLFSSIAAFLLAISKGLISGRNGCTESWNCSMLHWKWLRFQEVSSSLQLQGRVEAAFWKSVDKIPREKGPFWSNGHSRTGPENFHKKLGALLKSFFMYFPIIFVEFYPSC